MSLGIQSTSSSRSHYLKSDFGIIDLSKRGGIVARGILLDFVRYAERKGLKYDVTTSYPISLAQLKDIVEEEGLTIRQGDILIVRSGLSKWVKASNPQSEGPFKENTHIGVDPTPELLEWVWNNNFAAVAGDACVFETVPASDGSCMFSQRIINNNADLCGSHASSHCVYTRMGNADRRVAGLGSFGRSSREEQEMELLPHRVPPEY